MKDKDLQEADERSTSYVTVEDLLSAARSAHPHVDVDFGGAFMRMRLAPSYDDMLTLDRRRQELVATIRGDECPKDLRPFRKLSDDAISAAGLIAFQAERPAMSLHQALTLVSDGITVKIIMNAVQVAGTDHLIRAAKDRIERGKAASGSAPDTD